MLSQASPVTGSRTIPVRVLCADHRNRIPCQLHELGARAACSRTDGNRMQGRGRQNGKRCRVDIRSQFAAVARGADASLENFIERIEALCESAADCRISDCFGQCGADREATPGAAACWFSVLLILLN